LPTLAVDRLRKLQLKLYERAFIEAHAIVGSQSKLIIDYSTEFERSLPKSFSLSNQSTLLAAIKDHRFILYGDFHTLRQSQRGLLRIIRSHCDRSKSKRVVIALELIKARDQKILDQYLLGLISDQKFMEAISYNNDWGFPWDNFKMLLEFARSRSLPVIGINSPNGGRDNLALRDRFAARCLVNAAKKWPEHKIVCLIGEYHLADNHLPKLLAKEQKRLGLRGKTLRILNNVDEYYFRLPIKRQDSTTEYLKLRANYFCIMNTPPWMKWLSFSMWEELRNSDYLFAQKYDVNDFEIENAFEDFFDIDYIFLHFLKMILEFIHFQADSSDLESFHIHYSPEGNFINHLLSSSVTDPDELEKILHRCTNDGAYFATNSNSVLITYLSINNLAETAGQCLYSLLTKFNEDDPDPSCAFMKRIIKNCIGMLASKILNPRRKFLELKDYKRILKQRRPLQKTTIGRNRIELAEAVIKFDRWIKEASQKHLSSKKISIPFEILIVEQTHNYGLSRCIGQIIAIKLYRNMVGLSHPPHVIRKIFTKRISSKVSALKEIIYMYLTKHGSKKSELNQKL
jgi:hypothetical protein